MARENAVSALNILLHSVLVAVALGVLFSFAYPRTEIDFGLASLLSLGALIIVLGTRTIWQLVRRKKA